MLADFFCPPISFNSKKISAFEQRKDKSVKFTEKKQRHVRRIRTPKTRRFFCTAALIKKRQGSVAAAGLREAEYVFCAMRRFKKS